LLSPRPLFSSLLIPFSSFLSILHPSLNSFPFSRSQLQSFLFPKASNACSIHPKRQAGRHCRQACETGPKLSCVVKKNTISTLCYMLEKLFFFLPY
jgi:hypothetical protein